MKFRIFALLPLTLLLSLCNSRDNSAPQALPESLTASTQMLDTLVLNFSGKRALPENKKEFIMDFCHHILHENAKILAMREQVSAAKALYHKSLLTSKHCHFLQEAAKMYDLVDSNYSLKNINGNHFDQLLKRVDIVPGKMVISQAIVESNWGQSRFAKEGNSYFGIHCYSDGCGIAPQNATGFWLESYPNIDECIAGYLHFINTKRSMSNVRNTRYKMRQSGDNLEPTPLINALGNYAETGDAYHQQLRAVIKYYIPDNFPDHCNDYVCL